MDKPITTGDGGGTNTIPYTDALNLNYSVNKIEIGDIHPTDQNATVNLYTDINFSRHKEQPVLLAPGSPADLYIKVTAENRTTVLYYKITATRDSAAQPLTLSGGSLSGGIAGASDQSNTGLTQKQDGHAARLVFVGYKKRKQRIVFWKEGRCLQLGIGGFYKVYNSGRILR